MFTRVGKAGQAPVKTVRISFDGIDLLADEGRTVAAALAEAGLFRTRHAPSGAPRFAYCMMGVCFDCVVMIDGRPGQQACLVPVRDGMKIERSAAVAALS